MGRVTMAIDHLVGRYAVVTRCAGILTAAILRLAFSHPIDRAAAIDGLDDSRCTDGPWARLGRRYPVVWFLTLDRCDRDGKTSRRIRWNV